MARTTNNSFVTVRSEGGLLPPDLLARVAKGDGDLCCLKPEDYGLEKTDRLNEAISRCWARCQNYWAAFRSAQERLKATDTGVTETRNQWVLPLLEELDYELVFRSAAETVGDRKYPVSHRAGKDGPPVHIVSFRQPIDKTDAQGAAVDGQPKRSPHGLVQEYLNRTDHTWGIVTNGCTLRLLRDNASLSRAAFLEFDLAAMMEENVYADFVLLFLVLHRTRFPKDIADTQPCPLERWRESAVAQGTRARDHLRDGVETALRTLGQALLVHPENAALRESLQDGRLSTVDYYRQLLRLVYRMLFLLVAEERDLLFPAEAEARHRDVYGQFYSIGRLRDIAAQRHRYDRHDDLWRGLTKTFGMLRDGAEALGLPAVSGGLFNAKSCPDLDACQVGNAALLTAVRGLSQMQLGNVARRINYRDMDVEELGSVYESLLDFHPVVDTRAVTPSFDLIAGSERKTTGSYYTRPELVQELIKSALEPVIADRLAAAKTDADKRKALLALKVCDPACGSGHFLLAAARRIGKEVAILDAGESEPDPNAIRAGTREAVRHCIYGVDLNPLAVDLCKLALWIEGHTPGKPLTFLDHRIRQGNSLIGAAPKLMAKGIPDEAFNPIEGDDKAYCTQYKKQNKDERTGQLRLGAPDAPWEALGDLAASMMQLDAEEDSAEGLRRKEERWEQLVHSSGYEHGHLLADAWCAAFLWPKRKDKELLFPISEQVFREIRRNPHSTRPWMKAEVQRLATQYSFFHWHLEFPDVFCAETAEADGNAMGWRGGFDCVLGNPPWERIKLQEQEFFAAYDPEIANAPNQAARRRLIEALPHKNATLAAAFRVAKRASDGAGQFVRLSGRFPLTAVGDVNTYALFAEQFWLLLGPSARASLVCPLGIATDDSTKAFFSSVVRGEHLVGLMGFENEDKVLFPEVHNEFKFCVFTVSTCSVDGAHFVFFCRDARAAQDARRHVALRPDDFSLLNPNSRTCPVFRTAVDADLTRAVYQRVPVLVLDVPNVDPWGVTFLRMFDMASDSKLFEDEPSPGRLPLYEAKMIGQYDHRFASLVGVADSNGRESRKFVGWYSARYSDPSETVIPRYWVDENEVQDRLGLWSHRWLLAFRDITNAVGDRTVVFSLLPFSAVGHTAPLVFLKGLDEPCASPVLLANVNSIPFDYIARQKVGGHLTYFVLKQLPVIPPNGYAPRDLEFITRRVLELSYTAWDLQPFAKDIGYDGAPFPWDPARRALLRAELDAYYARLYGLTRDELRYILDPQDVYGPDFPGETFRVLKEKEIKQFGEYRTRRLVLEAWDRLEREGRLPEPYQRTDAETGGHGDAAIPTEAGTPMVEATVREVPAAYLAATDEPGPDLVLTPPPATPARKTARGASETVTPDGQRPLTAIEAALLKPGEAIVVLGREGRFIEAILKPGSAMLTVEYPDGETKKVMIPPAKVWRSR